MKYWMLLLIIMVALVGCETDVPTFEPQEEVPVRIDKARLDTVEEIYKTVGEVVPDSFEEIYLPQGSKIVDFFVEEGSEIQSGEVLFTYNFGGITENYLAEDNGFVSTIYSSKDEVVLNKPVLQLVENKKFSVKLMLSDESIEKLFIGNQVVVGLENEKVYRGQLVSISDEPNLITNMFEAKISIPDNAEVTLGEYVNLSFTTNAYDAVLVPSRAIVRKNGERFIYIYKEGQLEKQLVETGLSLGEWIELIGVSSSDFEFVISGQNYVTEYDRVKLIE
ncbi:MAG: HlyD family efflux transporter periplasmic adaptor subunit [Clostridia bacterium]|nr:HlyD family efflux transporter periplasmic adaptor subunit [Clostridia bacterium]